MIASLILGAAMSERDLQGHVLAIARARNWLCFHPFDSRRSEWGWPDLAMARRGTVLFAELKSATGKLTPAQQAWSQELPNWHIWRPEDLLNGTIEKRLR